MKNIAHIILDGNLTSDPEIKTLNSGKSVATFTLAVNHDYKSTSEEPGEVSFVEIELWDRQAVNAHEYLKKGKKATVIGELRQDRWKAQDGSNRSKLKVVGQMIRFDGLPGKKEREAA
ncbi:Single-stranded DNA-binding protein [Leptospira interrogans serovar Manilae]|uniref:Single-stranded DNA-binding protein n=1 Tax=Leptospira interrogans serovar Manilae TaxID=214675 RepID=A0AAQ1NY11_LEPIR|nr:single-stranded DNA-binding protein [Leptospira interrogans]AKP27088.1 single-stranded DNA-binding protein [Leptospira interrogans serovar Manilae]AKP30862.1 single-stranded DNA-binding protein [Leptospira interrogans serovar Manilae]EMJ55535.1 single-stranded DNA-binding protein [Leptospira interrogans serovar Valbuzzi str. Duyster]ENO71639.1 single-stranded DNA-binding protein [Leptospira interrogans serovar Valbuzzi str. Valbuzzi]EYU63607.1 single-stranded DNA-binding protein [Leptospira